ncbi:uncharacterized protein LOC131246616 [Magnolia sinica]|uniref:uncharacterized protein LOC131246616 n=1 Tax=Magnolia sinica TaxID=86752 RepID=UPI002659EE27|nr:uncharacterized protein LOC131246616 [Magnolia sinica]
MNGVDDGGGGSDVWETSHGHPCKACGELLIVQVGQFANCLIEARNELQHKSEIIQCKFTITKALLFKANRSSFNRLCQQTMYMDGILQFAVCVNRTVLQRSRPLILWAPTFEGHISKTIQMRRPFPTQLDDEEVADAANSTMVGVIELDSEKVQLLCDAANEEVDEKNKDQIANFLCPRNYVVSGGVKAVEAKAKSNSLNDG